MIGDKKQLSKARIRQLYPLVFLLSGIGGMLSLFLGIPGLSWNLLAVFLFGAALPAVWWLLYCRKHPRILAASILIFLGAGTVFWLFDPSLATQLQEIAGGILGRPLSENPEVTGGMLLIAGGIALLFFLLEILLRTHWPVYFLTTAVLLAAPQMGILVGNGACGFSGGILVHARAAKAETKQGGSGQENLLYGRLGDGRLFFGFDFGGGLVPGMVLPYRLYSRRLPSAQPETNQRRFLETCGRHYQPWEPLPGRYSGTGIMDKQSAHRNLIPEGVQRRGLRRRGMAAGG